MITRLLSLFIVCGCVYLLYKTDWPSRLSKRRENRSKKRATMFDVKDLIAKGKKDQAIALYREIFDTGTHDAQKAVDSLERSILEKDSEIE